VGNFSERDQHMGQDVLRDAVASAVKRDLPGGGFAWTKTASESIAQLMARRWPTMRCLGLRRPRGGR